MLLCIWIGLNDVAGQNTAPVLDAIGDKSVNELESLTFSATASDSDLPEQTLTFSLDAASISAGMNISSAGAFSWTPSESQGGAVYPVTVTVTDNGTGPDNLSDSETINITVAEVNTAPVLGAIGNKNVNEQSTLSFTATATDLDLPAQTLTFSLDAASISAGMSISSAGVFSWTPSESQGGSVYPVTVTVTDNGTGLDNLSDSETINITVAEVNDAPVVGDIAGQTIAEGGTFSTINLDDYVTDPDHADSEMTWTATGQSQLTVTISASRVATITAPSAEWNGSEEITFRATDPGGLFDSDAAVFAMTAENDAPVVGDIAGQTIAEGGTFSTINLDDYVTDPDHADSEMSWTATGQSQLTVTISAGRVATISIPSADWSGS
ncbi:Ig-like domain-containing protein, partial [Gaoshiqia sediminis]